MRRLRSGDAGSEIAGIEAVAGRGRVHRHHDLRHRYEFPRAGYGDKCAARAILDDDLAEQLEREYPRRIVSRMTKSLRTGKVLIDWSQNNGSKTTVAPYSLRARSHPTASTPVSWDEVSDCRRAADLVFTAEDVLGRVERSGDLLAEILQA